jgi:SWI/SNF-related matrix-associated actin-dependent regulator of chromatin subfamily A-like protein 1
VKLRPYQEVGAEWLTSRRYGYLADAMRLGKSAQAITAARKLGLEHKAMEIAVICPASVIPVWRKQFAMWWPMRPASHWHILSYDKVTRGALDMRVGNDYLRLDVLILDEAHYLKGKDAKRTKTVFGTRCDGINGLIRRANRVWCLSGTPMPNNPSELWPVLRALAPELIMHNGKPMNYWTFITKYCVIEDNGFGQVIKGGKNLDKLKAAIAPFMLRRRYEDVAADVPPLQFDTLPVNGVAPNLGELAKLLDGAETDEEILSRLRSASPHAASTRRLTGLAKVKGVLDWYADHRLSGGGKVVFMAYHTEVIDCLAGALKAPTVMGSTPARERESAILKFQEDPSCAAFVGQIQAAGTGIDLSAASTLVFVESDWVPGNNLQAAMRIQKVGKSEPSMVLNATLPKSIDERIAGACVRKMRDNAVLFG